MISMLKGEADITEYARAVNAVNNRSEEIIWKDEAGPILLFYCQQEKISEKAKTHNE